MRIDELRAKIANATPGQWRSMRDGNQYLDRGATLVGASRIDGLPRAWNPWRIAPDNQGVTRLRDEDADAIVAMRNSIDALLDVAEVAQRVASCAQSETVEVAQLRATLRRLAAK